MTFQYFFFDTYLGFFLQALPFALLAGFIAPAVRRKRHKEKAHEAWVFLLTCYLTGLFILTVVPRGLMTDLWYFIFYHRYGGSEIELFRFEFSLSPSFRSLTKENIFNVLMFLPFGVLFPLVHGKADFKKTALCGVCLSAAIEVLQLFTDRSFDIKDLILNALGAVIGAAVFFLIKTRLRKPVEVVAALIREGDRFLICQRPENKSRALLWEFVGGKVEQGETKEQALIRECREELDITLSVGEEFMTVTHRYPDITVRLTLFRAEIAEGTPKLLEHNDMRWITTEEIPDFSFCPADTEILDEIKKRF